MIKPITILFLLVVTGISFAAPSPTFEEKVDMTPWGDQVAVFTDGRVKSFETFARSFMPFIMGSKKFEGQEATFTYLDMMLRPDRYVDQDIIFVKHKSLRASIAGEINANTPSMRDRLAMFMKTGLISRELLRTPAVQTLLNLLRQDNRWVAVPI